MYGVHPPDPVRVRAGEPSSSLLVLCPFMDAPDAARFFFVWAQLPAPAPGFCTVRRGVAADARLDLV